MSINKFSNLGIKPFKKGLCELGNNSYAYLQPDGGWGWSNAGLVSDGGEAVIIDTLFDENLTKDMLKQMKKAEPKSMKNIVCLVNSHSNGDHCNGNNCVQTNQIISSEATFQEMKNESPETMALLIKEAPRMGELGRYFLHCFSHFDFQNVVTRRPNFTFSGKLKKKVGDKTIHLIEVGPAHTNGDILAFIPKDKIVYTGDILFIEGHPILWAGPIRNWISACDKILGMDVDIIVPGHGPVTDKRGVKAVKEYLVYIHDETKIRYKEGMSAVEASKDIDLGMFCTWGDRERIAVNVNSLYREFRGEKIREDITLLFSQMAELSNYD
jgi:glyoxylase-like metal-dependent hydrolase (beta-lactamase superfamily II)